MRNLVDYIEVIDCGFPPEFCDEVIEAYKNDTFYEGAVTIDGGVYSDKTLRDAKIIKMSQESSPSRKEIDSRMFTYVSRAMQGYMEKHPFLEISTDFGYELNKYEIGGFFKLHVDQIPGGIHSTDSSNKRIVTAVVRMNEDFEGGELSFFEGEEKYVPLVKKGTIVLFPSNFLFPHVVTPVTWGVRYTVVTWFA